MSDINDNADDYIIHVEIVDAVGDGGTFYGDHVVTGDPFIDPPPNWEYGQLLFDGYDEDPTGGSGGSGDAGPHDHDYLPLAGGTVTGDLTVDGTVTTASIVSDEPFTINTTNGMRLSSFRDDVNRTQEFTLVSTDLIELDAPDSKVSGDLQVDGAISAAGDLTVDENVTIKNSDQRGLVLDRTANTNVPGLAKVLSSYEESTTTLDLYADDNLAARFRGDKLSHLYGDLQVDGNADLKINAPADAWGVTSGTVFSDLGMLGGTQGSFGTAMTSNGYRNNGGKWTSLGVNGQAGATTIELHPDGTFHVRAASNFPTGSGPGPLVRFSVTETTTTVSNTFNPAGGTAFGISEGIDTADVLERAETATMPAPDDEGVATTDADVDSITVNEVVTALLAKVKELSAEIEELKGN